MAAGDLGRRLAVAGIGIPLGILVIYLGGWLLGGVMALVAWLGAREYYAMAGLRTGRPFVELGSAAAVALVLLASWMPRIDALAIGAWCVTMALLLVSMGATVFKRGVEGGPLAAAGTTVSGALYTGGTLAFAPLLMGLPAAGAGPGPLGDWAAPLLLIFTVAVTWMGDTWAYFSGMKFGRHKLIPAVSPKKTVEGSIGGLVGASLLGSLMGGLALHSIPVWGFSWAGGAGLGLALGAVAQVADLAESVIKREAGVKDSGSLLPGHGGVLDRFDAVLFTLPLTYGILVLRAWLG